MWGDCLHGATREPAPRKLSVSVCGRDGELPRGWPVRARWERVPGGRESGTEAESSQGGPGQSQTLQQPKARGGGLQGLRSVWVQHGEGRTLSAAPTGAGPRERTGRRARRHLPAEAGEEGRVTQVAAGQPAMRVGRGDLRCLPPSSASSQWSSLENPKDGLELSSCCAINPKSKWIKLT